jgi:hypothetical protein
MLMLSFRNDIKEGLNTGGNDLKIFNGVLAMKFYKIYYFLFWEMKNHNAEIKRLKNNKTIIF